MMVWEDSGFVWLLSRESGFRPPCRAQTPLMLIYWRINVGLFHKEED